MFRIWRERNQNLFKKISNRDKDKTKIGKNEKERKEGNTAHFWKGIKNKKGNKNKPVSCDAIGRTRVDTSKRPLLYSPLPHL